MGIAAPPTHPPCQRYLKANASSTASRPPGFTVGRQNSTNSMSRGFHQHHQGSSGSSSFFSFSDGGPTSQDAQQHVAQQSRRDKLRVQASGFDPATGHPLLPPIESEVEDDAGEHQHHMYEPTPGAVNMLAEMFNFAPPPPSGPSASELLASQMSAAGYRLALRPTQTPLASLSGDNNNNNNNWYNTSSVAGRHGHMLVGGTNLGETSSSPKEHTAGMTGLGPDSTAAAMHLFLMNPQQQQQQNQLHSRSSPSPPSPDQPGGLHAHHHQPFQAFGNTASFAAAGEGQTLSLSLSSSLQQLEMAKPEELRVRDGVLYFNQQQQQQAAIHLQQQQGHGQMSPIGHVGYGQAGVAGVLRNSRYSRAAQELLEEFCSVGRGQFKGVGRGGRGRAGSVSNPNTKGGAAGASSSAGAASSSASKDAPQLSPADRFENQRKKAKLISMLDEVDRRYNHYCEQMQMVVNFFDSVMGFGAATPYTALAQKAMSRHFRCLKDAIATQLRQTCELLGEKDAGTSSGLTKGETPRLRVLDQSLRQQRAFHHMGMMEQEAWRPQRGLPERSVNILRAWLFEHFLQPYPSDADKHLLARQTGLSRNQVSNWFINARVRLWKPMIEEMYQQEAKDMHDPSSASGPHSAADPTDSDPATSSHSPTTHIRHHHLDQITPTATAGGPQKMDPDAGLTGSDDTILMGIVDPVEQLLGGPDVGPDDMYMARYRPAGPGRMMRYGTPVGTSGDVSLTLGLQHTGGDGGRGNVPPDAGGRFSVRDYSGV